MAFLFLAQIVSSRITRNRIRNGRIIVSQDSEYVYLDESVFMEEVLKHQRPVIVEFGAEWCGSCRIMAPIVNDITAGYRDHIKVFRVDIDQNKDLAAKYGIQAKPTFLFIRNGEIVDHIIGSVSRKVFEYKLISFLSYE